jgi:hypothetical protein
MRLAGTMLLEAGIAINAIVHDAFVIEASSGDIEQVVAWAREIMMKAAEQVIGHAIPVSWDITKSGERFYDEDGEADFKLLQRMLEETTNARKVA